jgi:hypothetical protein
MTVAMTAMETTPSSEHAHCCSLLPGVHCSLFYRLPRLVPFGSRVEVDPKANACSASLILQQGGTEVRISFSLVGKEFCGSGCQRFSN